MKSLIPARSSSSCSCSTPPPLWPSAGRPPPPHSGQTLHGTQQIATCAGMGIVALGAGIGLLRHRVVQAWHPAPGKPGKREFPCRRWNLRRPPGRARSRWPRSTARFPGPGTCWCGYAPAASRHRRGLRADGRHAAGPGRADDRDPAWARAGLVATMPGSSAGPFAWPPLDQRPLNW